MAAADAFIDVNGLSDARREGLAAGEGGGGDERGRQGGETHGGFLVKQTGFQGWAASSSGGRTSARANVPHCFTCTGLVFTNQTWR